MSKSSTKNASMGDFERNAYRRLIQHVIRVNKLASEPFLMPVPKSVPGYYDVIKHPMDLTTIRQKLDSNAYKSRGEFERDFLLMVCNAYTFNHPQNVVHRNAFELEVSFRDSLVRAIRDINEHLVSERQSQIDKDRDERRQKKLALRRQAVLAERRKSNRAEDTPESLEKKLELLEQAVRGKPKKEAPQQIPVVRGLTDKQRSLVFEELGSLDHKHFPGLKAILEGETAASFTSDTELDLDFDKLPLSKQKDLLKFVERLKYQEQLHKQLSR